ncbi:hypothetical protein B9Q11_02260 [Candidatus Marsarchaeota G2 archaeon ECH_B_SAG-F08]|uniref:Uncharacterized protein n=1 Tax=Candidatus Marsarchaeota G2 archaeon ECH_B_SAG-F08 TaxID=1978165 RepID=A0A2R6BIG2_9ARCH|nr:MAG: hypothetical protein B9Q11_02260 [Candidatus Marsarchaeota G2 archaeon ECH_B_SAG-F08]
MVRVVFEPDYNESYLMPSSSVCENNWITTHLLFNLRRNLNEFCVVRMDETQTKLLRKAVNCNPNM